MKDQTRKPQASPSENSLDSKLDLDALLHPARAFAHPMDVARDADLTLSEKRAILASWASDACALEAAPDLRVITSGRVVSWDDIMDALRTLDREADGVRQPLPHYKRVLAHAKRRLAQHDPRSRGSDGSGTAPS